MDKLKAVWQFLKAATLGSEGHPLRPYAWMVALIACIIIVIKSIGLVTWQEVGFGCLFVLSAITILFVLERLLRARLPPGLPAFLYWSFSIAFVSATFAFGAFAFYRLFNPLNAAIERKPWQNKEILVSARFAHNALGAPDQVLFGDTTRDDSMRIKMDIWKTWIQDALRPTRGDEQTLVVVGRDQSGFDDHYSNIVGHVSLHHTVKMEEGVAFLVSNADPNGFRPVYRQLNFDLDPLGSNTNSVTIHEPNPGEKLWIILRVRSKDQTSLFSNPDSFEVRVEVK